MEGAKTSYVLANVGSSWGSLTNCTQILQHTVYAHTCTHTHTDMVCVKMRGGRDQSILWSNLYRPGLLQTQGFGGDFMKCCQHVVIPT